ncbi:MAG TPA: hypothetical protein VGQ82_01135 [Chthoniobacterales bacterium]|nr:hypothetical protein [Chthoniobacterales bacterium]
MKLPLGVEEEIKSLEAGELDPANFPHREHLRLGFEMLARHHFPEAALKMARGLRRLAAKSGRPEVYHETITIAFLAVIAQRQAQFVGLDWDAFAAANPDLQDKGCLEKWYMEAELRSVAARRTFILPRPAR